MGWLVVLAVLITPFILLKFSGRLPTRAGLALFWIASVVGGAWFLKEARDLERDLETVHTYPLPSEPGRHRIDLARMSQGSMKGVLRGGAGSVARPELEKARWSFTDPQIPAAWFESREHDPAGPGETLLFYVEWMGTDIRPTILEYAVEESRSSWFQGRVLVVGHDAGAKHILRNHGVAMLNLLGGILVGWGGLWMIVQIAKEIGRRRSIRPADRPE